MNIFGFTIIRTKKLKDISSCCMETHLGMIAAFMDSNGETHYDRNFFDDYSRDQLGEAYLNSWVADCLCDRDVHGDSNEQELASAIKCLAEYRENVSR
jgi:hypothetical protein